MTKRERLDEIVRRLNTASPFGSGAEARSALHAIMTAVEDEFSGVPENPNAATDPPDGRMYPPHDGFERKSRSRGVRLFKQTRHLTLIGENGSLRIERSNGDIEIDLHGADGRPVTDLLSETNDESNSSTA